MADVRCTPNVCHKSSATMSTTAVNVTLVISEMDLIVTLSIRARKTIVIEMRNVFHLEKLQVLLITTVNVTKALKEMDLYARSLWTHVRMSNVRQMPITP